MKHYWIFLFVIIGALAASFSLLPGDRELRVMYMKGQSYQLAKPEMEQRVRKGDLSMAVTIPLVELYNHYGESDKALKLMERFAKKNPDNIAAQKYLASLYKKAMRTEDYIAHLEKINQRHPTLKQFRTLVTHYDSKGMMGKKFITLENQLQRFPGESRDYYEMAVHRATKKDYTGALKALSKIDHALSIPEETAELHTGILLELGKTEQAETLASKWLTDNYSSRRFVRFIQLFQQNKTPVAALKLAKALEPSFQENIEARMLLAQLEIEVGDPSRAVTELAILERKEQLTGKHLEKIIIQAYSKANKQLALELASQLNAKNMAQENLMAISEAALKYDSPEIIQPLLKKYGNQFFRSRPLMVAHMLFRSNQVNQARQWTRRSAQNPARNLTEQMDLAQLYVGTERQIAIKGQPGRTELQSALTQRLTHAKLSEAMGDRVLEILLHLQPDRSLLPHLRERAQKRGGHWAASYTKFLQHNNADQELHDFQVWQAKNGEGSVDEKRAIAEQLIESHRPSDAEAIYWELAAKQPPDHPDVIQLLALWGMVPGLKQTNWLIERANGASGVKRSQWMRHMIQAGAAHSVVTMMRSATPSSQAEFDVYLEALVVLKDGPLMAEAIIARIPQENDLRRLTKFALYAESLDQFATAKKIYTVLLNKNPHSVTPLKQLGALAYQEGKWADVRDNLARYLKTAEPDWESIFYYAEANYHLGENFEAQKYCLRTVKMIDQRDDPTQQMGIASAYCLNQLGKRQEAIVLYKKLAAQADDDVLRARAHTALVHMNAVDATETH